MESNTDRKKKWKLKKINKCWFLDLGGKLTRMNMLNYATDVYMEDNVIFADDLVFQLTEESDEEVTVTEIKDICLKDKTSEYEEKESVVRSEKEEFVARNSANENESEESLKSESDRNENMAQDAPITNQNRSSRAELTLVEGPEYLNDDEEQEKDHELGSKECVTKKDPEYLNDDDEGQEKDHELGSEEYVPKKGNFSALLERFEQRVKKKPASKQKEEPLYTDISNTSKDFTPVSKDSGYGVEDDNNYEYTFFQPMKVRSASSHAVPGARIVTALFDFNHHSVDEISFQTQDKLKLRGEPLSSSGNYDWCYAEHMTTGKKGYIPLAYVTEDTRALEAQAWWHDMSREGAEVLLRMSNRPLGTYLVTPSDRGRKLVLSFLAPDSNSCRPRVEHYQIESHNGQLFIDFGSLFTDIFDLINFYQCTAGGLPCKLTKPLLRQSPVVYPRSLEIESESVAIIKSVKVGEYGELFTGKLFNTFDVTIVTKCKLAVDHFLAEAKIMYTFRQSRNFVRMLAVVLKPEPFMIILGETVHNTLQTYLRRDGGKTITFMSLTKMAAEINLL